MTREEFLKNLKTAIENSDVPMKDSLLETFYFYHPELAESEDERIRKDIIALIKFALEDGSAVSPGSHTTKEEALAYLEKQKEQKSSDEYIRRNSKELNALLAEQYDKGFWKGKSEKKTL